VFVVSSHRRRKNRKALVRAVERYKRTREKLKQLLLDANSTRARWRSRSCREAVRWFDMFASQGAPENMENFTEMCAT